jgi:hypothetical protein
MRAMKELDFQPHKSAEEFRKNYQLHDIAEVCGKNLLIQWGIKFDLFGKDMRYEKVWEKGKDKPDLILSYKGKEALLDWKGKHASRWIMNERAYKAYLDWKNKMNMPVFVTFFLFDDKENLIETRLAVVGLHNVKESSEKEWDKNKTIEFDNSLPAFTKPEIIKHFL